MSSENNEKKVLSRREALKRCATLTLGVTAIVVSRSSFGNMKCHSYTSSGGYSSFVDCYYSEAVDGGGVRG